MKQYNHKEVEERWQNNWDVNESFKVEENMKKEKYYSLIEFPYPSGEGLHVGHPRPYTALDIVSRKRRLEGYNVLFCMGWDAFGLPTENYAIKNKIHPSVVTKRNVERFKKQLKSLGLSFDWSREINTTEQEYYKWTQWIFIKLFEKGLAYKKEVAINWCVDCKVGLANEEVVDGKCERCGGEVERRLKNQWMLKITDYAEKLVDDLDLVDYIEAVKMQQKNWIGMSNGMEIKFGISCEKELKVYTTRPDTIFGVTYMVIAPEHPIIKELESQILNMGEVNCYIDQAVKKSDFERAELVKNKTGVELKGIVAVNPVTKKQIPIWISDYVLMSYGTGSIMAVPAHDTRDYDFAMKYNIPVVQVIEKNEMGQEYLVNSGFLDGLTVEQAKVEIQKWLEKKQVGTEKTNYKLKDWVFSRQRYWGEPIPLVYCEKCGWVALKEEDLPLVLPEVESYSPSDNGESPLSKLTEWINTSCPKCKGAAKRETDTMPQWAGSSWYFLRYTDPHNKDAFASFDNMKYWLPVDWYNGGMEHTTLHLLYSRFWHKFLYDCGLVPTKEPYKKRTSHGMILGSNNEKMSKSRGNVVNPDEIIEQYGADSLRLYEMFIGDFEKSVPWADNGIKGCRRFLERVWGLQELVEDGEVYSKDIEIIFNKTIKKVSQDYENLKFNTAIAALMTLLNKVYEKGHINRKEYETFLILLNPAAPHMTEELWQSLGFKGMLNEQSWPTWDEEKTIDEEVEIAIQINGKVKTTMKIKVDATSEEVKDLVFNDRNILSILEGKDIVKEIYVPNKIYNIVCKGK